jgi:hypothetical protein
MPEGLVAFMGWGMRHGSGLLIGMLCVLLLLLLLVFDAGRDWPLR